MKILQQDDIKKVIPHRGKMLLIDSVGILREGKVLGKYLFSGDEWFFQGHFDNHPIVPGVILCEVMAQASCCLFSNLQRTGLPYLIGIERVKFRKTVLPGDVFFSICELEGAKPPFYTVKCRGIVKKDVCVEGSITLLLR